MNVKTRLTRGKDKSWGHVEHERTRRQAFFCQHEYTPESHTNLWSLYQRSFLSLCSVCIWVRSCGWQQVLSSVTTTTLLRTKLKAEVTSRHRVRTGSEQAKSHASERTSNISKWPSKAHGIRMWQFYFVMEILQFRIRSLRPESFLVYRGSVRPSRKLPVLRRTYTGPERPKDKSPNMTVVLDWGYWWIFRLCFCSYCLAINILSRSRRTVTSLVRMTDCRRRFVLVTTSDLLSWSAKFWRVLLSYASSLFKIINFKLIIMYILSTSCNHVFCTCTYMDSPHGYQLWPKSKRRAPNNGVRDTVNPLRRCYIWVLKDDWTYLY
jgi:hypothetical protein